MKVTINGEVVAEERIKTEMDHLRPRYEYFAKQQNREPSEDELQSWCIDQLTRETLLQQEAARTQDPVPEETLAKAYERRAAEFKDMEKAEALPLLALRMQTEKLVADITAKAEAPSDEDVKGIYEQHTDSFMQPEQVRASHIVKHLDGRHEREKAYVDMLNVSEQLKQGASFEELAKEHSDCADKGGDLGFFGRGQMVQRFEDTVFAMEVGDVSDVFETEFGFHIAKVVEKKPEEPAPFEEVRDRIRHHLTERRRAEAIGEFIDALKEKAEIVVEK